MLPTLFTYSIAPFFFFAPWRHRKTANLCGDLAQNVTLCACACACVCVKPVVHFTKHSKLFIWHLQRNWLRTFRLQMANSRRLAVAKQRWTRHQKLYEPPQNSRRQECDKSNCYNEGPQKLGSSVQHLVNLATWRPRFVHPCRKAQ